jgi:hypothetical protein
MFQRLIGGKSKKVGKASSSVEVASNKDVTPQTTLEQCLSNSTTRDACLQRILHSAGFNMLRPLGDPTDDSAQWDLPRAPKPFAGVAGLILDAGRTRVIATVMESGEVQRLNKPLYLPPELLTESRPAFAIKDEDILRVMESSAPSPSPPPPAYRPAVPVRPSSASARKTIAKAVAMATGKAPSTDVPQSPPPPPTFVYSKPVINGAMPTVTSATKTDARALVDKVHKAPLMTDRTEADFLKSVRDARAKFDAKNKLKRNHDNSKQPPAAVTALIHSGDKMLPVAMAADVRRVMAERYNALKDDDSEEDDDSDNDDNDNWD